MTAFVPKHFHETEKQFLYDLLPIYGVKFYTAINNQQKGGQIKSEKYTYEGQTFNIVKDHNRISVVSQDETDCVTVFIEKKERLAIIHNMSFYENCSKEGLKAPGGGTLLFKLILSYLIKNKKEFGINKIVLTDHSFLYCPICDENVKLARLKMIIDGRTWYMKYGFMPYNSYKNKPDNDMITALEYNRKVLDKLKTTSIDVIKIAKKANNNLEVVKRLVKKYTNLRRFIIRLISEFTKYCCLIEYILQEIFIGTPSKKQLLYDFFNKQFDLNIS